MPQSHGRSAPESCVPSLLAALPYLTGLGAKACKIARHIPGLPRATFRDRPLTAAPSPQRPTYPLTDSNSTLIPLLTLVLATLACSSPQRPPDDLQMIGVVSTSGTLTPIARYANGIWDIPPWALPARRLFAATDGNGTWRWPPANQIWRASGRGIDVGRPPGTVAASVPDSWYFFSQSDHGRVVPTLSLRLASDVWSGDIRWVIATREGDPRAFPIRGVALSREPSAVLDTEAHPDVELLRDQLECADASRPEEAEGRRPDTPLRWLGMFTFDETTVGVLEIGPRSKEEYAVIEIEGQTTRIVAEWRRGPC